MQSDLLIAFVLFSLAIVLGYLFVSGFIWGAGYFPTPRKGIERALELLDLKDGDTLYDLGSGFGKVIITMAKMNRTTNFVGVEIDPLKCWFTRLRLRAKGLSQRVKIVRGNLLDVNLSSANALYVFLSQDTSIMKKLEMKIFVEMKPGSKIISYIHKFPDNWIPEKIENNVMLYVVPNSLKEGLGTK